jgi:hypothetical protein
MYWDPFFRQLNSETHHKKGKYFLCTCREAGKGGLIHEPGKRLRFIGQCSQEKACFKIRFDSKQVLSRKLQIVSRPKSRIKKRKKDLPITLDEFLGPSYTFVDNKSDIPKPPPPHKVANPNDS